MKVDVKLLYFGRTFEKDYRWIYYDKNISKESLYLISRDFCEYKENLFIRKLENDTLAIYKTLKSPVLDFKGREYNIIIGYFINVKYINYMSKDFIKIIDNLIEAPTKSASDSIEYQEKQITITLSEIADYTFFDKIILNKYEDICIYLKDNNRVKCKDLLQNKLVQDEISGKDDIETIDKKINIEKNKFIKNPNKLIELYEKKIQLLNDMKHNSDDI